MCLKANLALRRGLSAVAFLFPLSGFAGGTSVRCAEELTKAISNLSASPFQAQVIWRQAAFPRAWDTLHGDWVSRPLSGTLALSLTGKEDVLEFESHHFGDEIWIRDGQGRTRVRIPNRALKKNFTSSPFNYYDLTRLWRDLGDSTRWRCETNVSSQDKSTLLVRIHPRANLPFFRHEVELSHNPMLPYVVRSFDRWNVLTRTLRVDAYQGLGDKWVFMRMSSWTPDSLSITEIKLMNPIKLPSLPGSKPNEPSILATPDAMLPFDEDDESSGGLTQD